jgi:hypothetical protein
MIVYQADGLEMGIDGGGSHKGEASPLQFLGHPVRKRRGGGYLRHGGSAGVDRPAIDKVPEEGIEAAPLLPDRQKGPGIGDRCLEFPAVADESGIAEELLDRGRAKAGNLLGIEALEGATVGLALSEDRDPGKACLLGLEEEEFEMAALVMDG